MIAGFGGSVRARLTAFAGVAMALLCVAGSCLVLYGLHNTAVDIRTNEVLTAALKVVHQVKRGALPTVIPTTLEGIQVLNAGRRVVASSPELKGNPPITTVVPDADNANRTQVMCDLPAFPEQCVIMVIFRIYETDGDWLVYAAGPMPPWYVGPRVVAFLVGVSLAAVILTGFVTSRVVARTLAPVAAIRAKLDDITATDLGQRVPVPDNADELRALALTANQTLDRLESAVEQQRRFASDASHDLRSPITAMRAQVEGVMLHPQDADWQVTGHALLDSLDRLQAIVTDLLTLARLDAGAPGRREPVDLGELVSAETDRQRSKRVVARLQHDVVVEGDRLRLARLLTNLLDNAERHAEDTITVSVAKRDGHAVVEVNDDGAGIAPEHREVVFQRFARLDASRNRDAGGTGLGLPIAREVANAHGGSLAIEDSDTGARFVLRLPMRAG
ncbi:sensor histidine kinase [Nonomuraea sp. NPDC050536]|uniref:sensor histidine kinase n=1 Tax=Nonomuraea sp. NPDC050536 TaxID=3364366 RepID=UPI0037C5010B